MNCEAHINTTYSETKWGNKRVAVYVTGRRPYHLVSATIIVSIRKITSLRHEDYAIAGFMADAQQLRKQIVAVRFKQ